MAINWKQAWKDSISAKPVKMKLEIVAACALVGGKEVTVSKGTEPGTLIFARPWRAPQQLKVLAIQWNEHTTRSAGKAAVGAIVGGVLTGGIGLIAGAAIGGRKKHDDRGVIILEGDQHLYIKCNAAEYEGLTALL